MSTSLARAIAELAVSIESDPTLTCEELRSLVDDVRLTVLSYVGLKLTLADHGHLVTMTVFDPGVQASDIRATVQLPVCAMSRVAQRGSMIAFYARTPGAFVDLAADLGYALQIPVTHPTNLRPEDPAVDRDGLIDVDQADVPPVPVSQLIGVTERAAINRAVGVLLERGHHPDETHDELSRRAAGARVSPAAYATRLLAELATERGQVPDPHPFRTLGETP